MNLRDFIGKEIGLYPHDSYKKNAILLGVDEFGCTFQITTCEEGSGYKPNEIIFKNHSTNITFSNKSARIRPGK
jgi:hypothetical protein